jgi:hypothetical protein
MLVISNEMAEGIPLREAPRVWARNVEGQVPIVAPSLNPRPRRPAHHRVFARFLEAAEGTRTLDLLHGKQTL